jgi:hypothetical protein
MQAPIPGIHRKFRPPEAARCGSDCVGAIASSAGTFWKSYTTRTKHKSGASRPQDEDDSARGSLSKQLERVWASDGLDIGAATPEEIALSFRFATWIAWEQEGPSHNLPAQYGAVLTFNP